MGRSLEAPRSVSDERKLPDEHVLKITRILDALEAALQPTDMDLPGFAFHAPKGDQKGRYAVTVRANWRITFAWDSDDAIEVDYEGHH